MADEGVPEDAQQGAKWPAFPEPNASDPAALKDFLDRTKETLELMTGQRGPGEQYSQDARFVKLQKVVQNGDQTLSAAITTLDEVTVERDRALAQRTTIIEAELSDAAGDEPDLKAKLTEIQLAQVEGDTALAEDITTVEAIANGATAEGRVYLIAEASPEGAQASYGWYINAGKLKVGMHALVTDAGTAAIGFDASNFYLSDPQFGIARVFEYKDQVFTFNIPVTFNGAAIFNGTVTGPKIASGSISGIATGQSGGLRASCLLRVRNPDSKVLVLAFLNGTPNEANNPYFISGGDLIIRRGSQEIGRVNNNIAYVRDGDTALFALLSTAYAAYDYPGVDDFVTYVVDATNAPAGKGSVKIIALELAK